MILLSITTSSMYVPLTLIGFPTENLSVKKGFVSPNPRTRPRFSQKGLSPPKKNPPEMDSRVVEEENVKFRVPWEYVLLGIFETFACK